MRLAINMTWPVRATLCPKVTAPVCRALSRGQLSRAHARRVGSRIHVSRMLGRGNRVPDKEMFVLRYLKPECDGQDDNSSRGCLRAVPVDGEGSRCGHNPVLLILLESPHRQEYRGSVANPIGPARGQTGINLKNCLGAMLGRSRGVMGTVPCGTRVIVANPVQFQASLHAVHGGSLRHYDFRKLRDSVWKSIWSVGEIREDFRVRISNFAPTWIINACTGGSKGWGGINCAVSNCLLRAQLGCPLYATTHPAIWHRRPPCVSRLTPQP